jgi:hypothetical protein
MPNSEEIKGSWNELKGNLNRNSQNLQMMIYYEEGQEDEMWGKYSKTRKD